MSESKGGKSEWDWDIDDDDDNDDVNNGHHRDVANAVTTETSKSSQIQSEVAQNVNEETEVKKETKETESSWGIWGVLNKVIASDSDKQLTVTSTVTSLGNTVLDTLECIGKTTMNILQENDPLLMNKRKLLGLETEKPNLSQVLNEARKDADLLENTLKELQLEKCKEQLRFEVIFENECGLVHMEALEILSKESDLKLQTLLGSVHGNALAELHETIDIVTELMDDDLDADSEGNYDGNELKENLLAAIADAELAITFDDIANNWNTSLEWITTTATTTPASEDEIFAKGITALASTCALEMNKLHKIAELLLVKEHHSTASEVDAIVQLCKQFNLHLSGTTNRFASLLLTSSDTAKTHMNKLFSELQVATQNINNAFKLFVPILQMGAI